MTSAVLSLDHGRELAAAEASATHLDLWRAALQTHADRVALVSHHQRGAAFAWMHAGRDTLTWTYAQLDAGARALAARLAPCDGPIAVLLTSQAEWSLFFWAAAYLGVPFVPLNPKTAAKPAELLHILALVRPAVIVAADAGVAYDVQASAPGALDGIARHIALATSDRLRSSWQPLDRLFERDVEPLTTLVPSKDALILFTSGTTSLPKPCLLDAVTCSAGAYAYSEARNLGPEHVFISTLPNFHSYGIAWVLGLWSRGGAVVLPSKDFEAQAALHCIDAYRATHISLVPTTARSMLAHPYKDEISVRSLVSIDVSGADVVPAIIDACVAGFGVPAHVSYGMTESPGTLIWPEAGGSVLRNGNVLAGRAARGTCVKVCAPGSRDIVPRGEPGELHNGGVQVIKGYRDPAVSSANFYVQDGIQWVVTGDQAVMEADGAVRICGRYKDLIIRGGENISPASIEDHLTKCNGVSMAQVVGVPDDMAGEVPVAVVSTEHETRVDFHELKQSTLQHLGPAFAPKTILHLKADLGLPAWPTTTSGKVRKVELRALVRAHLERVEAEAAAKQPATTVEALLRIWTSISGHDSLRADSKIQSFADSLMMMQLSALVKRDLGRNVSVEDYKQCTTIQDQADLVDSRPLFTAKKPRASKRSGPPTLHDVPMVGGDAAAFAQLQTLVATHLHAQQLSWDEVQDVMPLPNWDAIFARRLRPTSWNLRFNYTAPCDVAVLETAVRRSLELHPTLRAVAIETGDDAAVLATMRVTDAWMAAATTRGHVVAEARDLSQLLLNDPVHDAAVAPGPMIKLHFASVRADNTSGLVVVGSHAVMDMSMTQLWLDDLTTLLTGQGELVPHEQFADYANAYHAHAHGPEAEAGVAYWAKKLAGVGSLPESAYWPPQRAPEFFKGADAGWARASGRRARPHERGVAAALKERAQKGIVRKTPVRDLARLKAEANVPVFMLVKAALALLNTATTGADQAIFGTINAARTWPFAAGYSAAEQARLDGNPLDIAGCTTEYVLDRVRVDASQTVLAFMQDVADEEEANSAHVHAPFSQIVDRLRDPLTARDARSFAQRERDADALLPLIRRQSFNWLPMAPAPGPAGGLQLLDRLTRMDNGLTTTGFLAGDKTSVVLSMAWDAEHLTLAEAETALAALATLVETMGRAESWGLTVGDLLRHVRATRRRPVSPGSWGIWSGLSSMVKRNRRRRD